MRKLLLGLIAALLAIGVPLAYADDENSVYEIRVTNLMRGQSLTPIMVAVHRPGVKLFTPGQPVSAELAILAEGGDTAPLSTVLAANPDVLEVITIAGRTGPGKTSVARVRTSGKFTNVSAAAMLIPTNDGFFAVKDVAVPRGRDVLVVESEAYDAGSEPNDELCANIPGPVCGGEGASPFAGGEGFVHIHAGIHGIGSLPAATFDWRNPVVEVSIQRVKQ